MEKFKIFVKKHYFTQIDDQIKKILIVFNKGYI